MTLTFSHVLYWHHAIVACLPRAILSFVWLNLLVNFRGRLDAVLSIQLKFFLVVSMFLR